MTLKIVFLKIITRSEDSMQRVSFLLHIKPGTEEEYRRRHQAVYPQLLQAFHEVGIHTYSIFLHEATLFAYMEGDNIAEALHILNTHPANRTWQQYMGDILLNTHPEHMQFLPEVFHFPNTRDPS